MHGTLLLKAGVRVNVVSERLGHATPAFTMATFSTSYRACKLKRSHLRGRPRIYRLQSGRRTGRRGRDPM